MRQTLPNYARKVSFYRQARAEKRRAPFLFGATGGLTGFLVAVALAVGAAGCGGDTANRERATEKTGPTYTIVFVDPTTGARSPEIKSALRDTLRRIADRGLRRQGSQIRAFALRQQTEAKTPQVHVKNAIAPLEETQFADREAMQKAQVQQQRNALLKKADTTLQNFFGLTQKKLLSKQGGDKNGYRSDVLGSIRVLREEVGDEWTQEKRNVRVYYLSDMFHAVPESKYRNFEVRPPESIQQARQWARKDAKAFRKTLRRAERSKDKPVLSGLTIRMVPGESATRAGAQAVKTYWKRFFSELGAKEITYN
jgi:hypothetical protein